MIPIFRYSTDGFVPKDQTYHRNFILECLNPPDLSEYQQNLIMESYKRSLPILDKLIMSDWDIGIWAFIGKLPEPYWITQSLNHLHPYDVQKLKLYELSIKPEARVYSPYSIIPELYIAQEFLNKYGEGSPCYVPYASMCTQKLD